MDQLKRSRKGFTLLELIIAIVLSAFVLLAASNLMINFGKFTTNADAALMGSAMGPFEEMVGWITAANAVAIRPETNITVPNTVYPGTCANGSCIEIRVDTSVAGVFSPTDYTNDTVYTYWLSGTQLLKSVNGLPAAGTAIARNISTLTFTRSGVNVNEISVTIEARVASGPMSDISREHLETTVIMRAQSAG